MQHATACQKKRNKKKNDSEKSLVCSGSRKPRQRKVLSQRSYRSVQYDGIVQMLMEL